MSGPIGDNTARASGVVASAGGGGKVLQVVQVYLQTSFTTASTTYVDVTGLTVDITPSASDSKILVSSYLTCSCTNWFAAKMVRDSTDIIVSTAATGVQTNLTWSNNSTYGYGVAGYSPTLLDDPATTSTVTYKIQAKVHTGPAPAAFGQSPSNHNNDVTGPSPNIIVLMEIGA